MTTKRNLIITFQATDKQRELLTQFCKDKINEKHYIAITQNIDDDYVLSLSFFASNPDMYFGIYSRSEKRIVKDLTLSDKTVVTALKRLNHKYAFNTSRQKPIEIDELILAWVNYVNSDYEDIKIPLD